MSADPATHIRTPDQRVRVFVSSTLVELAEERAAVRQAIETLRLTPVMFELGARPYPPRALYRAYLAQSHVFLGMYWQSYGWVAPDEDVSGLEDEYLLSDGRPRLLYVKQPAPDREDKLNELLHRIQAEDEASYRRFTSVDELAALIKDDLIVLLTERFESGLEASTQTPSRPMSVPPVPITPTIGRVHELDEIHRLVTGGCRLLTLTGPGGVGKSRLALEACRQLVETFPDGIAFIPLESVTEAGAVARVIAERIGASVEGSQPPLESAVDRLQGQRALLMIDNFEQVLEARLAIAELLDRCPGVSVLVTSRRPLRLRGEHLITLAPLFVPADDDGVPTGTAVEAIIQAPAVRLFEERARQVRSDFVVDASNAEAVAALVRRLDGLPLAIELAAARTSILEPGQMLERLERGATVPMSAGADFPERQRTLRATLEWSHALLTPAQQTLLARLSVFADGATLEAIEAVCSGHPVDDLLDDLSTLLDDGFLVAQRGSDGGQPRFVLLTTVRPFAAEHLDEGSERREVIERFVSWALGISAAGDPLLHHDAAARWPDLQFEARNLERAAQILIDAGDHERFVRLAWGILDWMWLFGRIQELAAWTQRAYDDCFSTTRRAEQPYQYRLRAAASWTRFVLGDVDGALAAQEGVDIEALAESDPACAALLEVNRALALPLVADGEENRRSATRARDLADSIGFTSVSAYSRIVLAGISVSRGDFTAAEQHGREALELGVRYDMRGVIAQQRGVLGLAAILQGHLDAGRDQLVAAREVLRTVPGQVQAALLLGPASALAAAEGRTDDAILASAVSDAVLGRLGLARWPMHEQARLALAPGLTPEQAERDAIAARAQAADVWDVLDVALGLPR